jgi:hypothetical protein
MNPAETSGRITRRWTGLAVALLLASCSSTDVQGQAGQQIGSDAQARLRGNVNIVGVWQGISDANDCLETEPGRCGAQENITLTILRDTGSGIKGSYRCAYGNQTCLGQNNTGKIVSVQIDRQNAAVRVLMPDATTCLFLGRVNQASITGNYVCYAGGAIREQGSWHGRRVY